MDVGMIVGLARRWMVRSEVGQWLSGGLAEGIYCTRTQITLFEICWQARRGEGDKMPFGKDSIGDKKREAKRRAVWGWVWRW